METTATFIKNCKRGAGFTVLFILISTVPSWADVNITANPTGEPYEVIISFDANSESNLVLELALDIRPENNANITEVTDTNECLKDTDPGYITWEACGKPDCWCYRHQCQGDCDGCPNFFRYTGLPDLKCLKESFGKTIPELLKTPYGCCADFDHIETFGRPVALSDFNILKANFGLADLPDCPNTHINEWKDPNSCLGPF
jgi:hypothetical protein